MFKNWKEDIYYLYLKIEQNLNFKWSEILYLFNNSKINQECGKKAYKLFFFLGHFNFKKTDRK